MLFFCMSYSSCYKPGSRSMSSTYNYCVLYCCIFCLFTFSSLHEQLRHVLKGVAHERSDITRDALKKLHSLLKNNKVR